jgi:hypothetical protein
MDTRPSIVEGLKNALSFALILVVGIVSGYLFITAETLEDKLKGRHQSAIKRTSRTR